MISGIFCIEMAFPLCASICAVSVVGLFWNFFFTYFTKHLGMPLFMAMKFNQAGPCPACLQHSDCYDDHALCCGRSRGPGEKNCTSLGETDRPRGKWLCQQGHLKTVFTPNEGKCCNLDQPDPFCSWPSHWWGPVMTPISPVLLSRLFDIDYHHLYDNNCQ